MKIIVCCFFNLYVCLFVCFQNYQQNNPKLLKLTISYINILLSDVHRVAASEGCAGQAAPILTSLPVHAREPLQDDNQNVHVNINNTQTDCLYGWYSQSELWQPTTQTVSPPGLSSWRDLGMVDVQQRLHWEGMGAVGDWRWQAGGCVILSGVFGDLAAGRT